MPQGQKKRAYTLKVREEARKHGNEIKHKGQTVYRNETISSLSELSRKMDVKSPATLY